MGGLLFALAAPSGSCVSHSDPSGRRRVKTTTAPATAVPIPSPTPESSRALFERSIRPILVRKCAPCHEPGGQMYARLPFDDPLVVSSHSEGLAKRLKGEDREALERWLAALPTRPTP